VQHLRRLPDPRGRLWARHTELVDALTEGDTAAARAILDAYTAYSLSLLEGLTADAAGKGPVRRPAQEDPPDRDADTLP